ncbi:MAG TPA: response regulator [Methanomassiliicoccales archaeon]|jgi:CheY-like chemotaxis protein
MSDNRLEVLIVEDNPGDAYIIKELLKDLKLNLNITLAEDGQEAVNFLKAKRNGTPGLVILDLNLPKINGFEVLSFMKSSQQLATIPVVVMTGSLRREDEQKSRELGAADYCIKPATVEEMERSEMCLRAHLEPLSRQRENKSGNGPSVRVSHHDYCSPGRDCRAPTPKCDRFVVDAYENGPWTPWR